jgi:hypothetical protein
VLTRPFKRIATDALCFCGRIKEKVNLGNKQNLLGTRQYPLTLSAEVDQQKQE